MDGLEKQNKRSHQNKATQNDIPHHTIIYNIAIVSSTMKLSINTLFAVAVAGFFSLAAAQEEETCSTGMTEFASTPQDFDSILINPTCTSGEMFTTSQLAWTIEPVQGSFSRIYSYPPEAVKVVLDQNVLTFDLKDMDQVPDKAGVVIQVPEAQLIEITVDGIMNYVRVARGFTNLLKVASLGMSSVMQADLTDSPFAAVTVDTSNSMHTVIGEDVSLQMYSVSSKLYLTGSVLGGEYSGFSNEVVVDGDVRDLSVSGNKNTLVSSDCSTVVVDTFSSSCTVMDVVPRIEYPSIPCTFPGCEKMCVSTSFGTCSCSEAECDGANSPMDEYKGDSATSNAKQCSIGGTSVVVFTTIISVIMSIVSL